MTQRPLKQDYPHQQQDLNHFTPNSSVGMETGQQVAFGGSPLQGKYQNDMKMQMMQKLAANSAFAKTYGNDIASYMKKISATDQSNHGLQKNGISRQPELGSFKADLDESKSFGGSGFSGTNNLAFESQISSQQQSNPYAQPHGLQQHQPVWAGRQRIACQLWTFQMMVDKVFFQKGRPQLATHELPLILQEMYQVLGVPLPPPEQVMPIIKQYTPQGGMFDVNIWRSLCFALFDPNP